MLNAPLVRQQAEKLAKQIAPSPKRRYLTQLTLRIALPLHDCQALTNATP